MNTFVDPQPHLVVRTVAFRRSHCVRRRSGRRPVGRKRLLCGWALGDLASASCRIPPDQLQSGRQMPRGQDRRIRPRRAPSDLPLRFGDRRRVWAERLADF